MPGDESFGNLDEQGESWTCFGGCGTPVDSATTVCDNCNRGPE